MTDVWETKRCDGCGAPVTTLAIATRVWCDRCEPDDVLFGTVNGVVPRAVDLHVQAMLLTLAVVAGGAVLAATAVLWRITRRFQ